MGCDGGTIPRRDELVRVKKRPEAKDKAAELAFQWLCCSISQTVLAAPVVMCGLGHLYNKLSVIEALLNKSLLPDTAKHIKSLKDVKELNLTPNPEYKPEDDKKEGSIDQRACPYICPMSGLEMSGKFKFVALWSCGCVFAERVLKEVSTKACIKCQKPFTDDDVVILNAKDDDLVLMEERMVKRQAAMKKQKDKKKPKQPLEQDTQETIVATPSTSKEPVNEKVSVKRTGALVVKENSKKIKADYSVAKDPKVSDVYKSIFTTHKSEQQQNRAHWITYNPFYN